MKPSLLLALATSLALACSPAAAQQAPQKVLRYAFPVAETGFDPAQISDLYSRTVAANIFEASDSAGRPACVCCRNPFAARTCLSRQCGCSRSP